jgi:hypothetical protein
LEAINPDPSQSSTMAVYLNGALQASGVAQAGTTPVTASLYINGQGGTSTNSFQSYVAEIIVFNTGLSQSNRYLVEGYLAWKWAIQSNLPINHPNYAVQIGGINVTTSRFAPDAIQSLQLWLDGNDPLSTGVSQTSGTVISTWYDKSIYKRNALGYGSPTMSSGNQVTLNGSTQFYSVPYSGVHQLETAFIVLKFTNTSGERNIICGQSNQSRQFTVFNNLLNMYSYQTGGLVTSTTVPPSSTLLLLSFTLNSSTNLSIYNNASLLTSVSGFTPSEETGINIGVNGLANGGYLNGTISEVLIYNSVLSNTNRQIVEGYLAWKWSIQASLPSNHPYYNKSP